MVDALITWVASVVGLIYVPVEYIAITLYYLDLRVRQEGYDMEIALDREYGSEQSSV
jgi:hypothetical protein